jgi:hypothetical protein
MEHEVGSLAAATSAAPLLAYAVQQKAGLLFVLTDKQDMAVSAE